MPVTASLEQNQKKNIKKPSVVQDEAMNTLLREVIKVHETNTAKGKFQVAHIKLLVCRWYSMYCQEQ